MVSAPLPFRSSGTILRPMLEVLFQNDDILILDKPAGLSVQPGAGVKTSLVEVVEREFGFRPFLVHRLDKDTSGCVAVAKSSPAAAAYGRLLADKGKAAKLYRAVVSGTPEAPSGVIRDAVEVRGVARAAETRWRLLASDKGFSLLELELGTGRMHQIRLHLAGRGHPVLGDDRHGDFPLNKRLAKEYGLKHLLLHAARLVFRTSPPMEAEARLPDHFLRFFERVGFTSLTEVVRPSAADTAGRPA